MTASLSLASPSFPRKGIVPEADRSEPRTAAPTPQEQYAHALLMTNEFLFID